MSKIFNPDYLQHLSSKYGLNPTKRYGQNFLIDEEVIEKIIEIAGLEKKDTVVEVGPGFGVLTMVLAEKAERVVSFEIEKKLQPYWEERLGALKNVEVVWGNVLKQFSIFNFQFLNNFPISNYQFPPYKVVANLPYQITSAVIRVFLEAENPPEKMTVMVQKEVGERICAGPGDMSLLSVAVQYYAEPKLEFVVPRTAFWPVPGVDSVVITITTPHSPPSKGGDVQLTPPYEGGARGGRDASFDQRFFQVVKAGFAQRRKLLSKNLEPVIGKKNKAKLKEIFEEMGLLPTVRAQELSVEQWRELVSRIAS